MRERAKKKGRTKLRPSRSFETGQALVEYLLMSAMLLFFSVTLFRMLQVQLKNLFTKAGVAILTAYI